MEVEHARNGHQHSVYGFDPAIAGFDEPADEGRSRNSKKTFRARPKLLHQLLVCAGMIMKRIHRAPNFKGFFQELSIGTSFLYAKGRILQDGVKLAHYGAHITNDPLDLAFQSCFVRVFRSHFYGVSIYVDTYDCFRA
jgi:hypothetical protein